MTQIWKHYYRDVQEGYQAESTQNKAENDSLVTYIATSEGLCVDPSKVAAIVEMPVPTNTAAVQRLLGWHSI